ncbi:hypothetical protein [Facilibium subflavum]|uniref:hypothetical protein n=1 Tax=Facilibium subflavum TaxID=2219058 RepID=UPI000E65DEF1|nr:hypothetical protein [Facilibium subflavum]
MRNKDQEFEESKDFFKTELSAQIDLGHKLCLLADFVDWDKLERHHLSNNFSESTGRPSKRLRQGKRTNSMNLVLRHLLWPLQNLVGSYAHMQYMVIDTMVIH